MAVDKDQSRPFLVRVASVAAMAGGAAWLAKVALIAVTNGQIGKAVTSALYVAGFLLPLVGAAGVALHFASRGGKLKKLGVYVVTVLAFLFAVSFISDLLEGLVEPFLDAGYLRDEVGVAVIGLVWLIVGFWLWSDSRSAGPSPRVA